MIKVHFVGAGPGAKDLITLRGAELLKKAQVVIYAGSLVNPELLEFCPAATVYNSAGMTLEEVIEVIQNASEEGLEVVRLHTGDPSLYGAVREQMDELDKLGIPYDSCPGVSACFGASASLNLEYTLPGVSQSLIITRMEGRTKVPESESIESFAAHHSTMAIYLSTSMLEKLAVRLIKGGYQPDTPAVLVYKATWPEEKIFFCTVETLAETAGKNAITKTALILVGEVLQTCEYEKSRLYAADFSTEFRQAKD
ncbi:MAG: precorrin-4 C(11)-methyltransferase [Acetatifactor sp.]|nr:precorrin-4 C(11)-methyltransferase [Acetatifactor sp.]